MIFRTTTIAKLRNMKRYLMILLTMTLSLSIHASLLLSLETQKKHNYSRHFVIAVDVSYTDLGCTRFITQQQTKDCIFNLLAKNGFNENDFLSLVSYSLSLGQPDFSNFVTIARDNRGIPVKWRQFENANDASIKLGSAVSWDDMVLRQHLRLCPHPRGSMQSLAKQYILKTLTSKNPKQICNETLLLMITDEVVNGIDNNYVNEYNEVTFHNPQVFSNLREEVFEFVRECDAMFQFERTKLQNCKEFSNDKISKNLRFKDKSNLKVVPYIVRPVVRPAIQAITDIPSPLPIKIVKGGYRLELNANVLSKIYEIYSLDLLLPNEKINIDINEGKLFVERDKLSDGDSIALQMDVKYIDGIYNGISMSPRIPIYNQGLTLKTKFRLQQDNKILGMIPLHDSFWWFFPDDIQKEIILWSVILILVVIIFIIYIAFKCFRRRTRYIPQNKDISLVRI